MRYVLQVLVLAMAGLLWVTVPKSRAESPPAAPGTQGITGNLDSGGNSGDAGRLTERKLTTREGKPTGGIEKINVNGQESSTVEDGPSLNPGYHEWIDRWSDCEKKERLERQHRLHQRKVDEAQ